MKQLLPFLAAVSLLSGAELLTQGERDRAMSELHASRKLFLDSISGLSPEQWNFKPAPDRWSVAECAEHIALSEDSLLELVKKVVSGPAITEKRPDPRSKDEQLLKMVTDRSRKAQAPEFLRPTHRWPTQQELVSHFKNSRDRTIAYVQTTQDDLRAHVAPHPALKELDAYQWLLLISAHSERHTAQINEVKADPNFPKK
jgi:hypothetical protein